MIFQRANTRYPSDELGTTDCQGAKTTFSDAKKRQCFRRTSNLSWLLSKKYGRSQMDSDEIQAIVCQETCIRFGANDSLNGKVCTATVKGL
jgi:hypothetical protein